MHILFTIILMATLAPPSLSSVLSSNISKSSTPSSSSSSSSSRPASTPTPTPTTTSAPATASYRPGSYAYYMNVQGMTPAQARQAVKDSSAMNISEGSMTQSGYIQDEKDSGNGYINQWRQYQAVDSAWNVYIAKTKAEAESWLAAGRGSNPMVEARKMKATPSINTSSKSNVDLTPVKFQKPTINVGTLESDTSGVLDTGKKDESSINKDKQYKEGTYFYYLKNQGMPAAQARQAANEFKASIKTPTVVPTTPTDATTVSTITPENIIPKSEAIKKADIDQEKATAKTNLDKLKTSQSDILNQNLSTLGSQETGIIAERDKSIDELNTLIQGYESNRLNQVRGGIMQALAQRGVNISQLSPESLIQLSGDIGSKAFTDIYNAKETSKSKIQALRQSAMNALNEIAAKKGMSQNEYTSKVNELDTAYNSDIQTLDTTFADFVLGVGEKKVNAETANKSAAQETLYKILTNVNVPLDQQAAFNNLIQPGDDAASVLKKLQTGLTPAQKKIIADARAAAAYASANATKERIAEEANATKIAIAQQAAATKLATAAKRASTATGSALKDLNTASTIAKNLYSVWKFTEGDAVLATVGIGQ